MFSVLITGTSQFYHKKIKNQGEFAMNKLRVTIINDTMNNKLHVSIDDGEFQVIQANNIIRTLIRIILNPSKYETEIAEY